MKVIKHTLIALILVATVGPGCKDTPVIPRSDSSEWKDHQDDRPDRSGQVLDTNDPTAIVAHWGFNGSGRDQTRQHPCTLHGDAEFVVTPDGGGLYTEDAASYASYTPPIDEITNGRITIDFELAAIFEANSAFNDPIILLNSNRPGHQQGDFSIKLDPSDGKLWLTQEDPVVSPTWNLKTGKSEWAPGWYRADVHWGGDGRMIKVSWDGGTETVSDAVVSPCFAPDAMETWIGKRDQDSPLIGLTIDKIKVKRRKPGRSHPEILLADDFNGALDQDVWSLSSNSFGGSAVIESGGYLAVNSGHQFGGGTWVGSKEEFSTAEKMSLKATCRTEYPSVGDDDDAFWGFFRQDQAGISFIAFRVIGGPDGPVFLAKVRNGDISKEFVIESADWQAMSEYRIDVGGGTAEFFVNGSLVWSFSGPEVPQVESEVRFDKTSPGQDRFLFVDCMSLTGADDCTCLPFPDSSK